MLFCKISKYYVFCLEEFTIKYDYMFYGGSKGYLAARERDFKLFSYEGEARATYRKQKRCAKSGKAEVKLARDINSSPLSQTFSR